MNNSKLATESITFDTQAINLKPKYEEREQTLVRLISAIRELSDTPAWITLKTELFSSTRLERELVEEAKKDSPDVLKLARLNGELKNLSKYDLGKLEKQYQVELLGLRKTLHDFNG